MRALLVLVAVAFLVAIQGCANLKQTATATSAAAPGDAESYLKWSMDRMKDLKTVQAECAWSMDLGGPTETRTFVYQKPNRFKVVTSPGNSFVQTSVSDGSKLVEYATGAGTGAQSYPAPQTIAEATSMQMRHPMFCGSLLYQFFGGSSNYEKLVQASKKKVEFGPSEKVEGEEARLVRFYGAESYGNVEALIGTKTGIVYRLRYDSEELQKQMAESEEAKKLAGGKGLPTFWTTEAYSKIRTNESIAEASFDTTVPDNLAVTNQEAPAQDKPPVALGSPAPDIELTAMDGSKVKLSSQKGKVVLIDFWATWCPPCREGLPITNRMHERFASKGLQVFAVSDEDRETVVKFVAENKYTFPAFLDPGAKAEKTYKVNGIPTVVIIDAAGKLSSYSVGLEGEDAVLANLKKAGIQ